MKDTLNKINSKKPKLLDQVRHVLRTKHYSLASEKAYITWIKRFILFLQKRHRREMGETEINQFLTHLAVNEKVAASTQNQALNAIVFLYKHVLKIEPGDFSNILWAKKSQKVPDVYNYEEVQSVIPNLFGVYQTMSILMCGSGLRLIECLRLRVNNIDFTGNKITIRSGKGEKDRITMLPEIVVPALQKHLQKVRKQHENDLQKGFGTVHLPYALARKYPNANKEWGWQYIFPASKLSTDARSNVKQRHHFDKSAVQKAVRQAIRKAGIHKHASCHTLSP